MTIHSTIFLIHDIYKIVAGEITFIMETLIRLLARHEEKSSFFVISWEIMSESLIRQVLIYKTIGIPIVLYIKTWRIRDSDIISQEITKNDDFSSCLAKSRISVSIIKVISPATIL